LFSLREYPYRSRWVINRHATFSAFVPQA
jgi:hypothetical protein